MYCSTDVCANFSQPNSKFCIECNYLFDPVDLPIELFDLIISYVPQSQIPYLQTISKNWGSRLGVNILNVVKCAADPRWKSNVTIKDIGKEEYIYAVHKMPVLRRFEQPSRISNQVKIKYVQTMIYETPYITIDDVIGFSEYIDAISCMNINPDKIPTEPTSILKNELTLRIEYNHKYFKFDTQVKSVEFIDNQDFIQTKTMEISINLEQNGYSFFVEQKKFVMRDISAALLDHMRPDVKFKIVYQPVAKLEYIDKNIATFRLYNVITDIKVKMKIVAT